MAAGRPLADPSRVAHVAVAFLERARGSRRSAGFFCAEERHIEGFSSLLLGEQPVWRPAEWPATVERNRGLREQIRRASSKGVRIRRVDARELHPGSPLRSQLEALAGEWVASRHMDPMKFLVGVEPFHCPDELYTFWQNATAEWSNSFRLYPFTLRAGGWWKTSCAIGERPTAPPSFSSMP